ncbi:unnamed protein product [Rhizophagus irregularis]|uniref:Uncharacterized protein n=1 Tax=Rhizophagus irregularis TaxID=588596 RepID=A0A916ECI0_9GLOM|nr:unnamed protein product [Rhizophagus irregularis]
MRRVTRPIKSTSKSAPTKSNKQKQQRFQEETPRSKHQQERTEEESDLNETSDKTNKSTSKSAPIKLILKSAKSTKLTQEESDDEVIKIKLPNIPKGNEKIIDDDNTDLEAENLKLKKQIDEVQVENARLQHENNRLTKYDKHRLLKMLSNRLFHSPEISETDKEDPTKSIIAIYDYSWRSNELKNLLRNVLNVHSSNKVKLICECKYDDKSFITEYDEEVEEVSRETTPTTGNTIENDEDHKGVTYITQYSV